MPHEGVELPALFATLPRLPVVRPRIRHVLAENAHSGFDLIQSPISVELLSRTLRKAIAEQRSACSAL